jgi:hypothetical protein
VPHRQRRNNGYATGRCVYGWDGKGGCGGDRGITPEAGQAHDAWCATPAVIIKGEGACATPATAEQRLRDGTLRLRVRVPCVVAAGTADLHALRATQPMSSRADDAYCATVPFADPPK